MLSYTKPLWIPLVFSALSGCLAPHIEISEPSVGLAFSTRSTDTLETDCEPGFSRTFPDEEGYIMRPGQDAVNLRFRFTDQTAITNVEVLMFTYSGRFDEPADLPVEAFEREDGTFERSHVWRYQAPAVAGIRNLIMPMVVRPGGTSGGAEIVVIATDRFDQTRQEFYSVRRYSAECQPN